MRAANVEYGKRGIFLNTGFCSRCRDCGVPLSGAGSGVSERRRVAAEEPPRAAVSALPALAASVMWGAADFLGGTATRRLPSHVVVGASEVLVLAVLVPVALVTDGLHTPAGYLPWAVAAGLVGLLALTAFLHRAPPGHLGHPTTATALPTEPRTVQPRHRLPTGAPANLAPPLPRRAMRKLCPPGRPLTRSAPGTVSPGPGGR